MFLYESFLKKDFDESVVEENLYSICDKVFFERNNELLSELAYRYLNAFLFCYYICIDLKHTISCFSIQTKNNEIIGFKLTNKYNEIIELPISSFVETLNAMMKSFAGKASDNLNFKYYYGNHQCPNKICRDKKQFYGELNIDLDNIGKNLKESLSITNIINIVSRNELKIKIKSEIKKKFIIGRQYSLRVSKRNSYFDPVYKTFILKKFAYKIRDKELPVLIMKQISGPMNNVISLSKYDCKLYHVKYEDGLQIFSMSLPFKII